MQPENGGLGVFAHEYAHDLGLPDLYDTNNVAGVENSVGFWSLMSSGSWLGRGEQAIGDLPGGMTAWDKLQLGWLNYERAEAATASSHTLGVSAYNTDLPQALVVELPSKRVTTPVVRPAGGAGQWWSDHGDGLSHTLTRTVDLTGRKGAELRLDGWWDIEKDYDYLYTQVSTDGGESWKALDGTADGEAITRDGGDKPALTGVSGAYRKLVYPLDAYAGKRIVLRFRYRTDGGVAGKGFGRTVPRCSRTTPRRGTGRAGRRAASRGWARRSPVTTRSTTSRRTGSTSPTTGRWRQGRTTSASPSPGTTGWSTTPTGRV
jgi:immune inhibitor A